jgi:predicted nucleotidyltransferase
MITKNQGEILNLFRKDILLSKTIRQISLMVKKPYPKIYEAVKELEKQKIIQIKSAGKASICEIKLSPEAISTLSFLDTQEAFSRKIPNIDRILKFEGFSEDIILVAGSYAKGRQKSSSDIDIAVITKSDAFKKSKLLENLTLTMKPEIHSIVFSHKDFLDMLISKEENFGKEVFKSRLIFRNAERYYTLIKEAIEHGFRG